MREIGDAQANGSPVQRAFRPVSHGAWAFFSPSPVNPPVKSGDARVIADKIVVGIKRLVHPDVIVKGAAVVG